MYTRTSVCCELLIVPKSKGKRKVKRNRVLKVLSAIIALRTVSAALLKI